MSGAAELLRRYLAQRRELGEQELFLDAEAAERLRRLLQPQPGARLADAAAAARSRPARPAQPATASASTAGQGGGPPAPDPRTPMEVRAGAPAHGAPAPDIVQIGDLDRLREVALGCPRCQLAKTRQHVVFGEGDAAARVVVVGEAPGADEDRTGRPFVGRAGRMLELLLQSIGFDRESVYICNVLKCRPPGNRNPEPEEIEACSPYLVRQLELIRPGAVLALGTFAAQTLLGSSTSIGRLRGQAHEYHGVPLVPTYHPAALLRNPGWIRPVWEDLQRLRAIVDAA